MEGFLNQDTSGKIAVKHGHFLINYGSWRYFSDLVLNGVGGGRGVLLSRLKRWLHSECQVLIFSLLLSVWGREAMARKPIRCDFFFFLHVLTSLCFQKCLQFKPFGLCALHQTGAKGRNMFKNCSTSSQACVNVRFFHNPCTSILNYFGVAITPLCPHNVRTSYNWTLVCNF